MTVRFFGLIPRKPDISSEEFHDHYRYPHGALGLGLTAMRKYVQSHHIDSELLGPDQRRFEAIAEGWYDSPEDGLGLATNPHYVAHLLPDEPLFVDLENLKWLYTDEVDVYEKPPLVEAEKWWDYESAPTSIKLIQFLDSQDAQEQKDTVLGHVKALGAFRFVRSEPNSKVYESEDPAYAAVHEFWWPTHWDLKSAVDAHPNVWTELTAIEGSSVALIARAERFR